MSKTLSHIQNRTSKTSSHAPSIVHQASSRFSPQITPPKIRYSAPKIIITEEPPVEKPPPKPVVIIDQYIVFYCSFSEDPYEIEQLKRAEIACLAIQVGFIVASNDGTIRHPMKFAGRNISTMNSMSVICCIAFQSAHAITKTSHCTLMTLWKENYNESSIIEKVDGFLSGGSDIIDAYMFEKAPQNPIVGRLHPTLYFPPIDLTFGEYVCFYCGIDWYALPNKGGIKRPNVLNVLNMLDKLGVLSIYEPEMPHKFKVWTEYRSYKGKLKFDGYSIIQEIRKCGICLALVSDEDVRSGIIPARFFEGLAAGVPIITNTNPIISRWFGDNVFYIDVTSVDRIAQQVLDHIAYFKNHSTETLLKMQNCRSIYLERFALDVQLKDLIDTIKAMWS